MKKFIGNKNLTKLLASGALLLITGLLVLAAKYGGGGFFDFYTPFSKTLLAAAARLTEPFKFSVGEMFIAVMVVYLVISLTISLIKRKFKVWLSNLVLLVSLLLFLFVAGWGLNHYAPPLGSKIGLEPREYSKEELYAATEYYMNKAAESALLLPCEEDGTSAVSSFDELSAAAGDGYAALLSEGYSVFDGSTARVKKLSFATLFSYTGTTGIFINITGEANVNPDTYKVSIPFTMCHEIAHRMGFAAEDEANFCGFLACRANKNPEFQYSGYYSAFIYCLNSLYEADPNAATELWSRAPERLLNDARAASAHYRRYEGRLQDAAQAVNDGYLKSFGEELGVRSYGAVTDYLIAWQLKQTR